MSFRQNRNDSLYPYLINIINILLSKKSNNTNTKIKGALLILLFICLVLLFYFIFSNKAHAFSGQDVKKGKQIVIQSGCVKCHSFVKGKRIDNIATLAGWGNKHYSLKKTERAIRSCKADIYCSQILTNKQVKYVARYLNSLK